ncbi:unnamed protein product [Prunus armeniaca]
MFSKLFDGKLNPTFVEGAFKLPLPSIRAYLKEPEEDQDFVSRRDCLSSIMRLALACSAEFPEED